MSDERPMDRRGFWRAALRGVLPGSDGSALPPHALPGPVAEGAPFRPPGALPEPAFREACAPGCRICVDACPRFVIIPSLDPNQPGGGDGRPYLLPERAACDLCGLCMPACPTGALVPTTPEAVRVGRAMVQPEACVRARGEACSVCLERCPFPQVAIHESEGMPEVVDAACTGCGLCAEACPPSAIRVVKRP